MLHAIFVIFFIPKFENDNGGYERYSKLSSYKFWVWGIHVRSWFSYTAKEPFIEKEKLRKEEKSV